MRTRVAVITDASAGIGLATAQSLLDRGWVVVAGARRLAQMHTLQRRGAHVMQVDVTEAGDREQFIAQAQSRFGKIDVLINHAGIGPLAATADSSDDLWHAVFETNVFAPAALARLVTPSMRAAGSGRIVTIGSMGGEFLTPLGGVYHASKYAVEAFTDALPAEMRPFGIGVVLFQPGPVRTALASTAADVLLSQGSPYGPAAEHVAATTRRALDSGRGVPQPKARRRGCREGMRAPVPARKMQGGSRGPTPPRPSAVAATGGVGWASEQPDSTDAPRPDNGAVVTPSC